MNVKAEMASVVASKYDVYIYISSRIIMYTCSLCRFYERSSMIHDFVILILQGMETMAVVTSTNDSYYMQLSYCVY